MMSPKKNSSKKNIVKKGSKRNNSTGKNGGATIYILIIMILFTAMLVMYNEFQKNGKSSKKKRIIVAENLFDDTEQNFDLKKEKKDEKIERKQNKDLNNDKKEKKVEKKRKIKLFFLTEDSISNKIRIKSVYREVSEKYLIKNSLEKLVAGPTSSEKNRGLISAVSNRIKINKVVINGNVATIDFNRFIEVGATGTILIKRINQIIYTVTQFKEISGVRIKINGRKRNTLGADGLSIVGVLKRGRF